MLISFAERTQRNLHCLRHPLVPHPLQLLHPFPRTASGLGRLHASRRPGGSLLFLIDNIQPPSFCIISLYS